MKDCLLLRLQPIADARIEDVALSMVSICNRLGVEVQVTFNGINLRASQGTNPDELVHSFYCVALEDR
ncbi:MAG: hypothetical protein AAGH90_10525 [Pseudomonadota bacterium]